MHALKRYRILIVIYGFALLLAFRELFSATQNPSRNAANASLLPAGTALEVQLYPNRAEALYSKGVECLMKKDLMGARSYFEKAITTGVKTNEHLLHGYALTLISLNADSEQIRSAISNWRRNYPHSRLPDPLEALGRVKKNSTPGTHANK